MADLAVARVIISLLSEMDLHHKAIMAAQGQVQHQIMAQAAVVARAPRQLVELAQGQLVVMAAQERQQTQGLAAEHMLAAAVQDYIMAAL
jgi:hypothetical protein